MGVVLPFAAPQGRNKAPDLLERARSDYRDLLAVTQYQVEEIAQTLVEMSQRVLSLSRGLETGQRSSITVAQIANELVNITNQLSIGNLIEASGAMKMLEERIRLLSGKEGRR